MASPEIPASRFDAAEAVRFLKLVHEPEDRVWFFAWSDENKEAPYEDQVLTSGHGGEPLWGQVETWLTSRVAVAVSLASFQHGAPQRTKQFARRLRVLGIDIDQKHAKALAPDAVTPEQVAQTAVARLAEHGLRPHFCVSSGRGVHVYLRVATAWVDDPVIRDEVETIWWKLGKLLGGATEKHDVSSVLRLPGTINFKDGQRQPVRFLSSLSGLAPLEKHYDWTALRGAGAALEGRPPPSWA